MQTQLQRDFVLNIATGWRNQDNSKHPRIKHALKITKPDEDQMIHIFHSFVLSHLFLLLSITFELYNLHLFPVEGRVGVVQVN